MRVFPLFLAVFLFVCATFSQAGDFFKTLDEVQVDIEKIVGCSTNKLCRRLLWHPIKNHIAVPMHARKRWIALSFEEDKKIGLEIIRQLEPQKVFYRSQKDEARVQNIAKGIQDILPAGLERKILLADTDEINALCLLGGTLVVTKGALNYFSDNELAFIIAHEYAHAISRHAAEGITKAIVMDFILEKLNEYIDKDDATDAEQETEKEKEIWQKLLLRGGGLLIAQVGVSLPYSRVMENEADAMALALLRQSGRNPSDGIDAMQRIATLEKEKPAFWEVYFSTHPTTESRIERMKTYCDGEKEMEIKLGSPDYPLDWSYWAFKMIREIGCDVIKRDTAEGEVLCIPGIFMDEAKVYLQALAPLFPKDNVKVIQWKAVRMLGWHQAEFRAFVLGRYLGKKLITQKEYLEKLTIVGHSLGNRVVTELLKMFDESNIQVKKVFLLGAAISHEDELLSKLKKVSREEVVNIFNPNDLVLKYAFYNANKVPALGLMGSRKTHDHLCEYQVPNGGSDSQKQDLSGVDPKNKKSTAEMIQDLSVFDTHGFHTYLKAMQDGMDGKLPRVTKKIDHMSIREPIVISYSIPTTGGTIRENYHGWELVVYHIPRVSIFGKKKKDDKFVGIIRNPYGVCCKFSTNEATICKEFESIKADIDKQLAQE